MVFSALGLLSGARGLLSGRGLKFAVLGLGAIAIIGTITYQSMKIQQQAQEIRAIEAEKRMLASECNERIMSMIAESQKVGIKAQAEVALKERAEWQLRMDAALKSATIAAESRTEAELEANELQKRLDQVYEANQDAQTWRDTPIPESVLGLRDR